jgi:hypothetical protein
VTTVAAATVLTGCHGGVQNIDPAGKNPGSGTNRTNQAQENTLPGTVVPGTVLQKLAKNSSEGAVAVAWAKKADGGGWDVSGPVSDNGTVSGIRGLWATKGNIQADDFNSTFYSLNKNAQQPTKVSTAAKDNLACTTAVKS